MSVNVKVHKSRPGKLGPVLASFSRAAPPVASLRGEDDEAATLGMGATKVMVGCQVRRGKKRPRQAALVAANELVRYEGRNFGSHGTKPSSKVAVAVYNEQEGRLDVFDTQHVFDMTPTVLAAAKPASDANSGSGSMEAQRKLLVQTFGSRQAKQQQKRKEENKVTIDSVESAHIVMQSATDAVTMNDEAAAAAGTTPAATIAEAAEAEDNERRKVLFPPYNPEAAEPAAVYSMEHLLTSSACRDLKEAVASLTSAIEREGRAASRADYERGAELSPFRARYQLRRYLGGRVLARLVEAGPYTAATRKALKSKVRTLLLMSFLMRLAATQRRTVRPRVPEAPQEEEEQEEVADEVADEVEMKEGDAAAEEKPKKQRRPLAAHELEVVGRSLELASAVPALWQAPESLASVLLGYFTEKRHARSRDPSREGFMTEYALTELCKNKLLFHICACALALEEFSISDVTTLAADLQVPAQKLVRSYFARLGCRSRLAKVTKQAVAAQAADEEAGKAKAPIRKRYAVDLRVPLVLPELTKKANGPKKRR